MSQEIFNKITPETAPVGARLLIRDARPYGDLREVTVLEWSPSKNAVKLHFLQACKVWVEDMPLLVEKLPPIALRDQYGNVHRRLS